MHVELSLEDCSSDPGSSNKDACHYQGYYPALSSQNSLVVENQSKTKSTENLRKPVNHRVQVPVATPEVAAVFKF